MAINNQLRQNNQVSKKPQFSQFAKNPNVITNISQSLGNAVKGKKFLSSLTSAVSNNPSLQDCDFTTIVSSALIGESLELSPSPQLGYYYLVPFNDSKNGRKVATFQIGYKGYLQLAIRSGKYKTINCLPIKEGELINFNPLTEEIEVDLIQDEETRENTPTCGYYAMFELVNGFKKAIYWNRSKMEAHALRYSKGYAAKKGYTFWEKDFDSMAQKTMLRQLLSKWGIMSIEMQSAFDQDMTFKDESTNSTVYFDNYQEEELEQQTKNIEKKDVIQDGELSLI